MAVTDTFFPRLSAFDPPEVSEGSLDPLGLGQLAGKLADALVPGYTERSRRPRFLVALALGARVLDRPDYPEGVYGEFPDGPANIAFERLLVESFARNEKPDDDEMRGIPGIGKARDAADANVRLSSRLHLVAPRAVGLWIAYKNLAQTLSILGDDGHLLENGFELLHAWERGIGEPGLATGSGEQTASFLGDIDRALEPLLSGTPGPWNPKSTWERLYRLLHPARMSRPEADVLRRLIVSGDARRDHVFSRIERSWSDDTSALEESELSVIQSLRDVEDEETRRQVEAILAYETVAVLLTQAFDILLHVGALRPDGRLDVESVLAADAVGPVFERIPSRLRRALDPAERLLDEVGEGDLSRRTLGWLHEGACTSAEALYEGLLARHVVTQRNKPPEGKRPWIEGADAARFVRTRYARLDPPVAAETIHPYRTSPVRRTLADLRSAER